MLASNVMIYKVTRVPSLVYGRVRSWTYILYVVNERYK